MTVIPESELEFRFFRAGGPGEAPVVEPVPIKKKGSRKR